MFHTRALSAIVLAPLFLGLIYLGRPYLHGLLAAIAVLMAWEYIRMDGKETGSRTALAPASVALAIAAATFLGGTIAIIISIVSTICIILIDQVAGRRGLHLVHGAVPYAALPAIALILIYVFGGTETLFWLIAVVWGTDIGAYAFGRVIGGAKLAPAISPKKTWSGAAGGLICGTAAGAGFMAALNMPLTAGMLIIAVAAALAAEIGDLLESALKRWYDVKDSGTLIPGHGGLMDRFDGLWAAAPVVALLCGMFDGDVSRW